MNINWVAVIDSCEEAYLARRVSMPAGSVPVKTELTKLYLENEENLGARPGNTVWISSTNPEGIILMRSIFDFYTMRFLRLYHGRGAGYLDQGKFFE